MSILKEELTDFAKELLSRTHKKINMTDMLVASVVNSSSSTQNQVSLKSLL